MVRNCVFDQYFGCSDKHVYHSYHHTYHHLYYHHACHFIITCRDRLRRMVVISNVVLIMTVMLLVVCSLARNAMLVSESCWWLFDNDTTATIALYALIESGWNLTFAALVVQARLLCPPVRLGGVMSRAVQALCGTRATPDDDATTPTSPPASLCVQPGEAHGTFAAADPLPHDHSTQTMASFASAGTDADAPPPSTLHSASSRAFSSKVLPDLRSSKAVVSSKTLRRPTHSRKRWARNGRSKLHGTSTLPMTNPGLMIMTGWACDVFYACAV